MKKTFIIAAAMTSLLWSCSENTSENKDVVSEKNPSESSVKKGNNINEVKATYTFDLKDKVIIKRSNKDFETEHPKVSQEFLDQYIKTTSLFALYADSEYKPTSAEFFHWGKITTKTGIIHLILEENIHAHDGGEPHTVIAIFLNKEDQKVNAKKMAYNGIIGGDFRTTLYSHIYENKIDQFSVDYTINSELSMETTVHDIDSVYKSFSFVNDGTEISLVDFSSTSFTK